MRYLFVLLLLATVGGTVLLVSCSQDKSTGPSDSLVGDYSGTYSYVVGTQVVEVDTILAIFTQDEFHMTRDVKISPPTLHDCFEIEGKYDFARRVTLKPTCDTCHQDQPATPPICDTARYAFGVYTIDERSETNLVLSSFQASNHVRKILDLRPVH